MLSDLTESLPLGQTRGIMFNEKKPARRAG
jgi:hypothetical protein